MVNLHRIKQKNLILLKLK